MGKRGLKNSVVASLEAPLVGVVVFPFVAGTVVDSNERRSGPAAALSLSSSLPAEIVGSISVEELEEGAGSDLQEIGSNELLVPCAHRVVVTMSEKVADGTSSSGAIVLDGKQSSGVAKQVGIPVEGLGLLSTEVQKGTPVRLAEVLNGLDGEVVRSGSVEEKKQLQKEFKLKEWIG